MKNKTIRPEKRVHPAEPIPFAYHHQQQLISLNDVVQQALLLYNIHIQNGNVVVRCETLPNVHGNETQLIRAFKRIISGIINDREQDAKQYLHIGCSEDDPEMMDLSIAAGFKSFQIDFRSNIKCKSAAVYDQAVVEEIRQLLQQNNASLTINVNEEESCFLTVVISGKY